MPIKTWRLTEEVGGARILLKREDLNHTGAHKVNNCIGQAMLAKARGSSSTDPLSKIPKKGQELLERFFGGGALVFGSAFLISGIAVSVEALCKRAPGSGAPVEAITGGASLGAHMETYGFSAVPSLVNKDPVVDINERNVESASKLPPPDGTILQPSKKNNP